MIAGVSPYLIGFVLFVIAVLLFVWALARIAADADLRSIRHYRRDRLGKVRRVHELGDEHSNVHVLPHVYDHEEREDFDP